MKNSANPLVRHRIRHTETPHGVERQTGGGWYGVLLAALGLMTLLGRAILIDLQAVRAVAGVVAHPHHLGS